MQSGGDPKPIAHGESELGRSAAAVSGNLGKPDAVFVPEHLACRQGRKHARSRHAKIPDAQADRWREASRAQARNRIAVVIDVDDLGQVVCGELDARRRDRLRPALRKNAVCDRRRDWANRSRPWNETDSDSGCHVTRQ